MYSLFQPHSQTYLSFSTEIHVFPPRNVPLLHKVFLNKQNRETHQKPVQSVLLEKCYLVTYSLFQCVSTFCHFFVPSPLSLTDAARSRHRRFPPQKQQHPRHDFSNIHPRQRLILSRTRSYDYDLSRDVLTFCASVTTFSQPCWSRRFSPLTTPTNRCHRHHPSPNIRTPLPPPFHHAQSSNGHESRAKAKLFLVTYSLFRAHHPIPPEPSE